MRPLTQSPIAARGLGERGFTLVELMVTVAIALFLLGGLFSIVQNVRATYANQQLLAQLEDAERLAMTMMTDVTQEAGYFPDPTVHTAGDLPAAAVSGMVPAFATGQGISGSHLNGTGVPGDVLSVRYETPGTPLPAGDLILNCLGTSNTSGGPLVYTNTFYVNGSQQLVCDLGAGPQPLVGGVTNLQVLYGVKTNGNPGNDVDTYMTADQVTAANDWASVTSVTITLTFVNPLAGGTTTEGVTQPATLSFQRVIDIMNRTGEGAS